MKRTQGVVLAAAVVLLLTLSACGGIRETEAPPEPVLPEATSAQPIQEPETSPVQVQQPDEPKETDEEEEPVMQMKIGDTVVAVAWENNESVEALRALAEAEPLTIRMSMYGGFEQVGSIGRSLPRNDVQTSTGAGDIVLYSGNQLVVFYGSNSWAYTRLGHITDRTAAELSELLGHGDVTITIGKGL